MVGHVFFFQGVKSDRERGSIRERLLQEAQHLHPLHQPGDFPIKPTTVDDNGVGEI